MVYGSRFRVYDLWFVVQGFLFKVFGIFGNNSFMVSSLMVDGVYDSEMLVQVLGLSVQGLGYRVYDIGFRVKDLVISIFISFG
jgi:hypothetical protein